MTGIILIKWKSLYDIWKRWITALLHLKENFYVIVNAKIDVLKLVRVIATDLFILCFGYC